MKISQLSLLLAALTFGEVRAAELRQGLPSDVPPLRAMQYGKADIRYEYVCGYGMPINVSSMKSPNMNIYTWFSWAGGDAVMLTKRTPTNVQETWVVHTRASLTKNYQYEYFPNEAAFKSEYPALLCSVLEKRSAKDAAGRAEKKRLQQEKYNIEDKNKPWWEKRSVDR